jgi:hypothetical protein
MVIAKSCHSWFPFHMLQLCETHSWYQLILSFKTTMFHIVPPHLTPDLTPASCSGAVGWRGARGALTAAGRWRSKACRLAGGSERSEGAGSLGSLGSGLKKHRGEKGDPESSPETEETPNVDVDCRLWRLCSWRFEVPLKKLGIPNVAKDVQLCKEFLKDYFIRYIRWYVFKNAKTFCSKTSSCASCYLFLCYRMWISASCKGLIPSRRQMPCHCSIISIT